MRCLVIRAGSGILPSVMGRDSNAPHICQNRVVPAAPSGAYRRYALVYDLVWRAAPYDRFVDLCLEAAAAQGTAVRRVLVAACGTGNAAVELAGRGYEVTGFDLSLPMLSVAAAKPFYDAANASDKLKLIVQENTPHRVNPESIDAGIAWFVRWLKP